MRRFKNNNTRRKQLRIRRETIERLREPPKLAARMPNPAEELLREWPELGAFGVEWMKKWLVLRERLVEIAKVMRKFPWVVDVIRQRPASILNPYAVVVYMARDGSEACLSLTSSKAYCAQNGVARETRLELAFSQYKTKIREVFSRRDCWHLPRRRENT